MKMEFGNAHTELLPFLTFSFEQVVTQGFPAVGTAEPSVIHDEIGKSKTSASMVMNEAVFKPRIAGRLSRLGLRQGSVVECCLARQGQDPRINPRTGKILSRFMN